jgi:ATP-dependent protease ClpP protease subunit
MIIIGNTARILINTEVSSSLHEELVPFIEGLENMHEITNIEVIINSPGGSVVAGYSIYSALVRSSKRVTTIIDGIAASIAGVIFMAGEVRKAYDHALFMAHNPSGGSEKVLSKIKESLMTILDKEGFTSSEVTKETWLTVDQMRKREILDNVIEVDKGKMVEVQASVSELFEVCNKINLEKYNNMEDKNEEIVDEAVVETAEVVVEETVAETVDEVVNEEIVESTEENKEEETPSIEKEEETEAPEEVEEAVITNEEKTEEVEAKVEIEEVENFVEIKALNTELVETNNKLVGEIEELKNKLTKYEEDSVKSEKADYLKSKNIAITDTWLNLDLNVIKELTKTVNLKSPENEFKEEEKEMKISELSKEERMELSNSNPELYSKIFFENK